MQWFALVLLMCGVAIFHSKSSSDDAEAESSPAEEGGGGNSVGDGVGGGGDALGGREIASEIAKESYMVGIAAVVGASMISGLAGVYIEKILKRGGQHSVSLWIRNIQLASNTHIH